MIGNKVELERILDTINTQDSLDRLDALLIRNEDVECPLTNNFAPGIYEREVFVPAGTLFTTYTHKEDHIYRGIRGDLLIWDTISNEWNLATSPCRGITKAGTKRVVYTVSDVIWLTVHRNPDDCTDTEILEERLFEKYENPYLSLNEIESKQIGRKKLQ